MREGDVYRDVVSGARTDRREYYALLARLEKEDADVVVAWNVSRLGRNTLDGAWLMVKAKEHGYRVETTQEGLDFTADPASELVFDILTAAAKFQRNTILSDMMRGKKRGHKDGKWVNGPAPFGYVADGPRGARQLVPGPDAPVLREVFVRYAAGATLQEIVDWLNDLELRHVAGGKRARSWAPNTVGRILDWPVYRGFVVFRGELAKGLHEPLVDEDLWHMVRARRAARAAEYGRRRARASA